MIIIGIDPGASGAFSGLSDGQDPFVFKFDATERDIADVFAANAQRAVGIETYAYIERVHSMPRQGVSSSFKFGMNYGFLRACLITNGYVFEEVSPRRWQTAMGCLSGGDKNVTKARAQQLFPNIKITHAIADALLIAEYGRRLRAGEFSK